MARWSAAHVDPPGTGTAPGDLELVRRFVNTRDVEQSSDLLASPAALDRWLREAGLAGDAGAARGDTRAGRAAAWARALDAGAGSADGPAASAQPVSSGRDGGRDGGAGRPADAADLRRAVELREALRAVLRAHVTAGEPPTPPGDHAESEREPRHAPEPAGRLRDVAASLTVALGVAADGRVLPVPAEPGVPGALARIALICAEAAATGTWSRLKACGAQDCQWAFYDRSPTRSGCWCTMAVCGSRAKARAYRRRARSVAAARGGDQ